MGRTWAVIKRSGVVNNKINLSVVSWSLPSVNQFSVSMAGSNYYLLGITTAMSGIAVVTFRVYEANPSSLIQMKLGDAGLNGLLSGLNLKFGRSGTSVGRFSSVPSSMSGLYRYDPKPHVRKCQYNAYDQACDFKSKSHLVPPLISGIASLLLGFVGSFGVYFGLWAAQFPKYNLGTFTLLIVSMVVTGVAINAAAYFFYVALK